MLDDTQDWRSLLTEPRGRATTKNQWDRMSFVGKTLPETLAIRNGYDGARDDGSFYSLCGTCSRASTKPCWGGECDKCHRERNEDLKREKVEQRTGSTGSYPSGHVSL